MNEKELFKYGSVSGLLEELNLLNSVKFTNHYGHVNSKLTKKQREIFDAFGFDVKTYV